MTRFASALLVLAATLSIYAQPPVRDSISKTGSAVIRGRVISAETGDPVRKARVTASTDGAPPNRVFTDLDGRFEIQDLPSGRYAITVTKAGYATTRFGARRTSDRPLVVDVADAATINGLVIRMPKGAAITGRVLDDLGDPVLAVTVTAARLVRTDDRLAIAVAGSGTTDDLGEYRIGGLMAGSYIVSAASGARGAIGPVTSWSRAYYPGASNAADAQPLTVRPGDEIPGVDFTIQPKRLGRLSVSIVDAAGRTPDGMTFLTVAAASPFGILDGARSIGIAGSTPAFGVEPGEWIVAARAMADGRGGDAGQSEGIALLPISMGSDDLAVRVILSKGGRIRGTISTEGSATSDPSIELAARLVSASGALPLLGPAAVEVARPVQGTFTLQNLVGRREFRLERSRLWMLRSLTYQGRSLLDEPVDFTGNEAWAGVQAVITTRRQTLTGLVVGPDKNPMTDYSVLVFPVDRARLRSPGRWVRWARPNQTGRFIVDDLPAGDYLAIAVDDLDDVMWSTPEYLERLRGRATLVTLVEGARESVTLELAAVS